MFMCVPRLSQVKGKHFYILTKALNISCLRTSISWKKDDRVYTFIEILNKKQKNLIVPCVYKHPKHEVKDFTNNHMMSLLDKLSNETKDVMITDDFKVNLINYNDDKTLVTFLTLCFLTPFYLLSPPQLESQEILKP